MRRLLTKSTTVGWGHSNQFACLLIVKSNCVSCNGLNRNLLHNIPTLTESLKAAAIVGMQFEDTWHLTKHVKGMLPKNS